MKTSAQKIIIYNIVLLISVTGAFLLGQTSLFTSNSLQIFAFAVILYILNQFFSTKIDFLKSNKMLLDFSILSVAIILFIAMTGYLSSPLFFLMYFLVFGVSLLLHPSAALTIAFTSSVLFLATPKKDLVAELMQLSSLFLITPLALLFGSQYIKLQQAKDKTSLLEKDEKQLAKEVVSQEKQVRDWTSRDFKNQLIKIWENIDNLAKSIGLTNNQKTKLSEISNQLSKLLKSGEDMEKKVAK